ncbi:Uncharacterised protein [Salmonella enterica subsp. enterica serovar Bovismorbificans]|uniref:Uncharacterized protein n=1 Tax=Salmonella enterica subsp. enterica serovar Bovismorbificans TaxID=58097 RepID=A0A655BZ96_SALET|nr:Uncharacterised protein [Salmonella enterica subsp. enterica serovar Bovismorbificans]
MQRLTFSKGIIFIVFLGIIFFHFVNGITQRSGAINIANGNAINRLK